MTAADAASDAGERRDDVQADLFDDMLQQLLEGRTPDLEAMARQRPEQAAEIQKAWALASAVAGRRDPGRPSLGGYDILRELGRGGMGTVYLARHQHLGREVAIKVLPPSLGLSPSAKRRFLDEAKALARLRHDHIVRIHRIIDDRDMLAFEMEYVDGASLTLLLEQLRPHRGHASLAHLAACLGTDAGGLGARSLIEYFVRLGIDIARALHAVHQNGLIHRDVKPSNILLRRDGRPLLADFGLARGLDLTVTQQGAFAGTPIYAAPEQLRGEELDPRADVYALAVTLYEAIALSPPLASGSTADVLRRIEEGRIPPLRQQAPQVSRDLETILGKAMEPEARNRYASAAEFAADLERLLQLQPIHAVPAGLLRRTAKFARRQRRTLLAGCAGALLVALAMVPVVRHAAASDSTRQRARELARAARLELLAPESRNIAWNRAVWGDGPRLRQLPAAASDPVDALQKATADYDAALALGPDDDSVGLERAAVAAALWLRTESPRRRQHEDEVLGSAGFAAVAAPLLPLTRRAAQLLVESDFDPQPLIRELPTASRADRLELGLLAFLLGEFQLCEHSWVGIDVAASRSPLLDAGLGIMYQADGRSERAFLRLSAARQSFPESAVIAMELADAALALGELGLVRELLALPAEAASVRQQRRLQADLDAVGGDRERAAGVYRELLRLDPSDPTPQHRLAMLALGDGDLAAARQRLDALLQEWPEVARFRLDRARLALLQGDLPGYLQQACYVTASDFGAHRSLGSIGDLLEILRLGGLQQLLQQGLAASGAQLQGHRWTGAERPLHTLARRLDVGRCQDLVAGFGAFRRRCAGMLLREESDLGLGLRAQALAQAMPGLASVLGLDTVLFASAALPAIGEWWWQHLPMPWFGLPLALGLVPSDGALQPLLRADDDPNRRQGYAVDCLDDLDGDGVPEVLVGSPVLDPKRSHGRVQVVSGRSLRVLFTIDSEQPALLFGHSVAAAGDVDGDGLGDWIVGAPLGDVDGEGPGIAQIFASRDGALLRTLRGEQPGFGVDVVGVGDVDGDGKSEVLVGTSPVVQNRMAQGSAQLFAGADGRLLRTFSCEQAGVYFGSAVAAAGDVDGDGTGDLIVGGNHGYTAGLVKVFSGRTGAVLLAWYDDSTATGFGSQVGSAGDLDGDGHGDLLVSACGSLQRFADHGRVLVFSGRDGSILQSFRSGRTNDAFGFAATPIGDLDGDGAPDYAIGSPLAGPLACGMVEVWSGRQGRPLCRFVGPFENACFGMALVHQDGGGRVEDLLVGAPMLPAAGDVWAIRPTRPLPR